MSSLAGRRIELWVEPRGGRAAVNPVMAKLLERLAAEGMEVAVRVPESEVSDAELGDRRTRPPDLVLLKSATSLAMTIAVAEERAGIRFLNPAAVSLAAHDKAGTIARLAAAQLPVPLTYLAAPGVALTARPGGGGLGWVAKPVRGLHGAGIAAGATPAEALAAATPVRGADWVVDDGTQLLQSRVGDLVDDDLKVYVAGEKVFAALKRPGPGSHLTDAHLRTDLDTQTLAIVRRAGRALGLRCYGVDLRVADGQPWIIDVNPFPGYRGLPEAVEALRTEVVRALSGEGL